MLAACQAGGRLHIDFPTGNVSQKIMSSFSDEETMKLRLENEVLKKLEENFTFFLSIIDNEKFDVEMELAAQKVSVENLSKDQEKRAEESASMQRELERAMDENRRLAHEKEQLLSQHQKEVEDLKEQIADCQEDKNDINEEVNLSHLEIERLEEELKEAEIRLRVYRRFQRQQNQERLKLISSMEELSMENFNLVEKLKNAEAEVKRLKEHNETLVERYNYLNNIVNVLANPPNPPAENEADPEVAAQGNDELNRES